MRIIALATAGAAGTVARHLVQLAITARAANPALGTLAVNLAGCLLFGVAWGLLERAGRLDGDLRLVVLTGFLGAFTTFSALLADSARLAHDGSPLLGLGNVAAQLLGGFALLALGVAATRVA